MPRYVTINVCTAIAPIVAGSYLWSSYTQQFALSNEPDVSRDTGGGS